MASTQIILRNSGVTGNTPTPSNMELGELALNYTDGKLFYKNGSGDIVPVFLSPTAAPENAASPGIAGQIAYDSFYVYICTATNTWKRALLGTW